MIPTAAPLSKSQFNYTIIADMVATAYEKVRQVIITVNLILAWLTDIDSRISALEFKVNGPMDPNPTLPPVPDGPDVTPIDPNGGGLSNRHPSAYDVSSNAGIPALKRKK